MQSTLWRCQSIHLYHGKDRKYGLVLPSWLVLYPWAFGAQMQCQIQGRLKYRFHFLYRLRWRQVPQASKKETWPFYRQEGHCGKALSLAAPSCESSSGHHAPGYQVSPKYHAWRQNHSESWRHLFSNHQRGAGRLWIVLCHILWAVQLCRRDAALSCALPLHIPAQDGISPRLKTVSHGLPYI